MADELRTVFLDKLDKLNECLKGLIDLEGVLKAYAEGMNKPEVLQTFETTVNGLTELKMLFSEIMANAADKGDVIASVDLNSLIALADELDQAGLAKEAEEIDELVKKAVDAGQFDPNLAPTQERLGLEEYQGDPDVAQIDSIFEEFKSNPTEEGFSSIEEALRGLLEKRKMTDEEAATQVEQYDKEIGVPEGGWPDNPSYKASKMILEQLAKTADKLDDMGAKEAADKIDEFIGKHGEDFLDYKGEDESGEQSKRYDSKHHHALQIREPKKDQERVDREGRKEHHVSTQKSTAASSLNTRYCPDHVGVSVGRIGENTYQCPLDGQVYNWETGWTDYDGNQHPGGSVAAQTPQSGDYQTSHRIFDTRDNITNSVK